MKNKLSLISITSAIRTYLLGLGYTVKQIDDFLDTAEIYIDSGWECSETGFDSVWINLEKNKICLVNAHHYKYEGWVMVLRSEEYI